MRLVQFSSVIILAFLTACSGGSGILAPPAAGLQALDLSPAPLELTNDEPAVAFTVQNDVVGVAYTATTAANCQSASGGIYVAGDGQPQTAVAGTPTMFLAYAAGTPPDACKIAVTTSTGQTGGVDATYQVIVVQSHRRAPMAVSPGVTPASATITKANQIVLLSVSGFSGAVTANAGACASGTSGISVTANAASGSGMVTIAPFGVGAISKACTVTLTDTAGNHVAVPVTLAIPALNKFTVTGGPVQFACAGSTLPMHCRTIQNVTLSESGATAFHIAPRAFPKRSCADKFEGPLKYTTTGGALSLDATGPTATVAFDGLLPTSAPGCELIPITDGGNPAQIVTVNVNAQTGAAPPPAIGAAAPPACTGNDPFVAVPGAPHGMYVWNPNTFYTAQLQKYSIGKDKDPTLCGASLVIFWKDVEPTKGAFHFSSVEDAAAPYTSAGLTVNLLFSDATEGATNTVTPPWVLAEVPNSSCGGPQMPAYWDPTYEADWEDLITHAITYFTNSSTIKANVGYMRFATGGGAEALPPPGFNDGGACQAEWANLGFTPAVWLNHTINIVNAMGSVPTTKQIMASLPELPGNDLYAVPNQFAAAAVAKHVGLSFESLGSQNTTAPGTTPAACNTAAKIIVLHFCQAYTKYAGVVPLAMQPITATTNTSVANIDITKLLPYALDNNIQIFELYPEEWLSADAPVGGGLTFVNATNQPVYRQALQSASLVLGASNGQ